MRRFVTGALAAGRSMTPIHGVVQIDVTQLRESCAASGGRVTLTPALVAAVGRSAGRHPLVHSYRDWRGRLIVPRVVDVSLLVEVESEGGSFPLAKVIRAADTRSAEDITRELAAIKRGDHGVEDRLMAWAPILARIPGVIRLFYWALARIPTARARAGTVSVSSVGMFAGGSGTAIGLPTMSTLSVFVGGLSLRPWVVDGDIVVRDILDLTVTVDHRVVDGAPAARFSADLRNLIEHGAEWLVENSAECP